MGEEKKELRGIARLLFHSNIEKKPFDDLKKEVNSKKGSQKLRFILKKLAGSNNEAEKQELRRLLPDALEGGSSQVLHLAYNSFSEGLEPAYFWILDFMTSTLGMKANKTKDDYEASVGSSFFSETGMKATRMQEQAIKMMGTINTVTRSIINLIYDLKEFDIRLSEYDDYKGRDQGKKERALLVLKQIWMDQVDVKKGVGSINGLAQQLQFVTLRDAFLHVKNPEDVNAKDLDLNERVKRILSQKLTEFYKWLEASEEEIRKRYNIERSYLRSQVASLKTYAEWTKPYLIAAKKLGMKEFGDPRFGSPNLVHAFNNMEIELELMGSSQVKAASLIEKGVLPEEAETTEPIYGVVIINFKFRSVPHSVNTQQGYQYRQGGKFDIRFRSYALTDKELKALTAAQQDEGWDLVSDMVDTSLKELAKDLQKYVEKKEEKEIREAAEEDFRKGPPPPGAFSSLFGGFKDLVKPLGISLKHQSQKEYFDQIVLQQAQGTADGRAFTLYDVYKKAHGMLSV